MRVVTPTSGRLVTAHIKSNKDVKVAMLTQCRESQLHSSRFLLVALLFWSSTSSAQTRVHSNQINPYGGRDAYRYVSSRGNDSNDGLSPGNAYATPQKCNSVVTELGGGTC